MAEHAEGPAPVFVELGLTPAWVGYSADVGNPVMAGEVARAPHAHLSGTENPTERKEIEDALAGLKMSGNDGRTSEKDRSDHLNEFAQDDE